MLLSAQRSGVTPREKRTYPGRIRLQKTWFGLFRCLQKSPHGGLNHAPRATGTTDPYRLFKDVLIPVHVPEPKILNPLILWAYPH